LGQYLTTGGAADPFLPRLLEAIRQTNRIDLTVAFIKSSGLALVYPALVDAVETRDARLRVLMSDYLDVIDPQALRRLMLLA
jgi:HKD family nuclease